MKIENLSFKLLSLAIAIILWGVVLGSRSVEVTKEVPIQVITADQVIPSSDLPDKISFRLAGPKAFLRAILDRRDEPIQVNLTASKPGFVTYRFFSDNIRLPIGVKVLSVHPAAITVRLEPVKVRDIPVKVELRGVPPEGFQIGKLTLLPSTVKLSGPESRIAQMNEVWTAPIDLSTATRNIERPTTVDLSGFPGVKLVGDPPAIRLIVEPITANFRIRNVAIKVIADHPYRLSEKSATLLVRTSKEQMEELQSGQVSVEVDLRGKAKGRYEMPLKVTLPDGVGLKQTIPELVSVTLY